jgi:predicted PurR-regulated permease PerM
MIVLFLYSIRPNADLINNIVDLFSNILKFIDKVNIKYNLNIDLDVYVEKIINYFINNSFFLIKNVINYLSKIIFIVILSICILLNIDYLIMIINKTKHKQLLFNINEKLKKYLIANIKIISVQFVEYTLVFFIIGHPNYLLLGLLNSINSFIPYVGTFVTNVIAITTASVIDQKLLLLTCIISILLPNVDAYIITPRIYKQTNELPQTFCILFVIIFGSLYGIFGILFSIPSLIVVIEILKYKNVVKLE